MPLRALAQNDAAVLEAFVAMAAFPPARELPPGALELPHARRWLEGWGDELGVGWEEHGQLVGAAWARQIVPVLARDDAGTPLPEVIVAVDEHARGTGVGRRLMAALMGEASDRGVPGLALTVSELNPIALALYEQLGFERIDSSGSAQVVMVWWARRGS